MTRLGSALAGMQYRWAENMAASGELATLCQRRINRPVTAAAVMHDTAARPPRAFALVFTESPPMLWWLSLENARVGAVIRWEELANCVVYTEAKRRGGEWRIEISIARTHELLEGTLARGAERLAGHLDAAEFFLERA